MLTDWLIFLDLLEENNQNTSFLRLMTSITFGIIETHYCNHTKSYGYGSGYGYGYGYRSGYGYGYGYRYGNGYGYGDGNGYGYGDGNGYVNGDGFGDGYNYSNCYDEDH